MKFRFFFYWFEFGMAFYIRWSSESDVKKMSCDGFILRLLRTGVWGQIALINEGYLG